MGWTGRRWVGYNSTAASKHSPGVPPVRKTSGEGEGWLDKPETMTTAITTATMVLAVARAAPLAVRFHVSPAGCGGGWLNDPTGPFEYRGVTHLFYEYDSEGNASSHRSVSWGHVAGNLSHWRCLLPALRPGRDFDNRSTAYDKAGVYTGSVTVVDGA